MADTPIPPDPERFLAARPGYVFHFPRDHGAHPGFQTEWWYYTGHLRTDDGRRFGYQVTFFRRAVRSSRSPDPASPRSAWRLDDLYFAHLALSDLDGQRFRFADAMSRAGLGKAGADPERLHVWLDRWHSRKGDRAEAPHHLAALAQDFGLELTLTAVKPLTVHGLQGISRKGPSEGQASHYYSQTRLETTGTLLLDGQRWPVTGQSWMDHEFGSGDLGDSLVGWDWFSVQLESGEELMLYRLRTTDGQADVASSGTWVDRDGRPQHLEADALQVEVLDRWTSPVSHAVYPSRWRISIPSKQAIFVVAPELADQELRTTHSTGITYWEGAVRIDGTVKGIPATGAGYVELTGYADRYRPRR